MDPKSVSLVQDSFKIVRPISENVAELFYQKLFKLDPKLKELFPQNPELMKMQGSKLMSMLGSAITGLSNFETLKPALEDLGKRHLEYKVEHYHYQTVGEALIGALEEGLGDKFTYDIKNAWVDVYVTMSDVMIASAYQKVK